MYNGTSARRSGGGDLSGNAAHAWAAWVGLIPQPHGFLPLNTEPALGQGAVGAAIFLDPREEAGATDPEPPR